jgi:phage tail-like protein
MAEPKSASKDSRTYFPPVSFYFAVKIGDDQLGFQEVTGLEMTISLKTEGEGSAATQVPDKRSYSNVTLKRGWLSTDSATFDWVNQTFHSDFGSQVTPKDVYIELLDPATKSPLMVWQAIRAWPVKWSFSSLNASKNEVLIESIELTLEELKFVKS